MRARFGYPGAETGEEKFALTRYGTTIEVMVAALVEDGGSRMEETTHALVDTGAEESCIDVRLARRLRMPVLDTVSVFWAGESREHDVYGASLFVPKLNLGVQGLFVGIDFIPGDIPQEVILGRTFLEGTIMIYDGLTGRVTIASQPIEE